MLFDPEEIGEGVIYVKSDGTLAVKSMTSSYITVYMRVSPSDGGTTSPAVGSYAVKQGSREIVEAFPEPGYQFDRWSDGGSQRHEVLWDLGKTLTAYFTKIPVTRYTLSLSASPSNGGTTTGEGTYDSGTKVTVKATPNSGWRFVRWSDGLAQQHTVTMNANKSLTAYFEKYSVTGDEIFSGTSLTSSTYWRANGSSSILSVTGGVATFKFVDPDIKNTVSFNKGYLGGKIEQGHKYRLSFQIKSSVNNVSLIAWLGSEDSVYDNISDDVVYGDVNGGNLSTSYKTISFELTAEYRDSTVSDALVFLVGQVCTLYVKSISLKEV